MVVLTGAIAVTLSFEVPRQAAGLAVGGGWWRACSSQSVCDRVHADLLG